ncbi:lasso peptide biosynthesis B2 protein [Pseudomonadota bacterium]
MTGGLEQWRKLPPWERRLLLSSAALLPLIGLLIRLAGYRKTKNLLQSWVPSSAKVNPYRMPHDDPERIAQLVAIATRHGPYRATCLRQALAVWWLLARRGVQADIKFGVQPNQPELKAHAWVEVNGKALNHPPTIKQDYLVLGIGVPVESGAEEP